MLNQDSRGKTFSPLSVCAPRQWSKIVHFQFLSNNFCLSVWFPSFHCGSLKWPATRTEWMSVSTWSPERALDPLLPLFWLKVGEKTYVALKLVIHHLEWKKAHIEVHSLECKLFFSAFVQVLPFTKYCVLSAAWRIRSLPGGDPTPVKDWSPFWSKSLELTLGWLIFRVLCRLWNVCVRFFDSIQEQCMNYNLWLDL